MKQKLAAFLRMKKKSGEAEAGGAAAAETPGTTVLADVFVAERLCTRPVAPGWAAPETLLGPLPHAARRVLQQFDPDIRCGPGGQCAPGLRFAPQASRQCAPPPSRLAPAHPNQVRTPLCPSRRPAEGGGEGGGGGNFLRMQCLSLTSFI